MDLASIISAAIGILIGFVIGIAILIWIDRQSAGPRF